MLSIEAQSALRRMRANVVAGKWIRRDYHLTEDRACLVGMIDNELETKGGMRTRLHHVSQNPLEMGFLNTAEEVSVALKRAIAIKRGFYGGVQGWNDSVALNAEDVVALIDEALQVGSGGPWH